MANRIPIIDLKKISSGNATPEDWQETADIMRGVLHEVGFMYLINHGIPSDVVRIYITLYRFYLIWVII